MAIHRTRRPQVVDAMGQVMVTCRACKIAKPASEMSKDRRKAKGYITKCAACERLRAAAYRESHRQQVRERDRERHLRNSEQRAKDIRRWTREHPEIVKARYGTDKVRARKALQQAVRSGHVIKPSACQDCGRSDLSLHGHHHDYTKPFDVAWVCRWCHGKRHRLPDIEQDSEREVAS